MSLGGLQIRVARAMYEANGFVRPWDHPKTAQLWQAHYLNMAQVALDAICKPSDETIRQSAYSQLRAEQNTPVDRPTQDSPS